MNEIQSADDSRVPLVKRGQDRVEYPKGKELASPPPQDVSPLTRSFLKRRKLNTTSSVILTKLEQHEKNKMIRHEERMKAKQERMEVLAEERKLALEIEREKLKIKQEKNELLRQLLGSQQRGAQKYQLSDEDL